jgi:peptide/nickel transport system permease protein
MAVSVSDPSRDSIPIVTAGYRRWRTLRRHPLFWIGGGLLVALALFCYMGPLVYRVDPLAVHITHNMRPPGGAYPLGTDILGRDELARLMVGGQGFILVGFAAALFSSLVGVLIGLAAGFSGGLIDRAFMWFTDTVLGIPQLVPLFLVVVLARPSVSTMIVVLALTGWPLVSRLVRAEALSAREREYVESARSGGATSWRIMLRHLMPNVMGTVVVASSGQLSITLLVLAIASYLGYGLPPPDPNWAGMVADSTQYLYANAWWLLWLPGMAFVLLQLSVNFLADALREAFDPRTNRGAV